MFFDDPLRTIEMRLQSQQRTKGPIGYGSRPAVPDTVRQTSGVDEAAATVRARADDIARRAVELTFDSQGRLCEEEAAGLHVRALAGSVVAGDPKIFGDYAVWAAELLQRRAIEAEQLAALLRATRRAIGELVPSAVDVVEPHLEAGERALAG